MASTKPFSIQVVSWRVRLAGISNLAGVSRMPDFGSRFHWTGCEQNRYDVLLWKQVVTLRRGVGLEVVSSRFYGRGKSWMDRSEERRVGKECGSRWSPDHYR